MKNLDGVDLIRKERERQVAEEGWTPEHDDAHTHGTLARAAACYAYPTMSHRNVAWPFEPSWWKPTGDRVRDLTKAGALIAAEIDRLQRMRGSPGIEENEQKFKWILKELKRLQTCKIPPRVLIHEHGYGHKSIQIQRSCGGTVDTLD